MMNCVLTLLQTLFGTKSIALIQAFLCRPWFSRRWILQEVMMAQQATVHCGNSSMPWSWVEKALKVLQTATELKRGGFHLGENVVRPLKLFSILDSGLGFLDLIWHSHTAACQEPNIFLSISIAEFHNILTLKTEIRFTILYLKEGVFIYMIITANEIKRKKVQPFVSADFYHLSHFL